MKPDDEIAPQERLSISHLLVWTATSAVLLGYQRAMASFSGDQTVVSNLITLCYAPLFGAGLGACLLSLWRRANGGPRFPVHPGHWLLIVGGVTGVTSIVFQTLVVFALAQATSYPVFIGIRLVEFIVSGILFGIAIGRVRGLWWIAFSMGLVSTLTMLLFMVLALFDFEWLFFSYRFQIEPLLSAVVAFVVLVVAVFDWCSDAQRDYLHWTGIIARVIYSALVIAIPWLYQWFPPVSP